MARARVWGRLAALLLLCAGAAEATPLHLDAVAILMRHGVRPPTKAEPLPKGAAHDAWPGWPVAPGYLTPHGAEAVKRLGAYDRLAFADAGLLPASGCPTAATVAIWADVDERTVKSAEAWAEGLAPGCALPVGHSAEARDPLFSPLEGDGGALDPQAAEAAVLARLGPSGLQAVLAAQHARLAKLDAVLGCCAKPLCPTDQPRCTLETLPAAVVATKKGRPKLTGGLDLGATAAEILMLEYAEGKPLAEVGWGRVSRAEIEDLLTLHPTQYNVLMRPPAIGRASAAPLARRMLAAVATPGPRLTLLLGHDTNIAALGSMLDLHWKVESFPADDPPPGGALILERLSDEDGAAYVRMAYRAQSMDQMRNLDRLDRAHPAFRQVLIIPGCPAVRDGACRLADFVKLVGN